MLSKSQKTIFEYIANTIAEDSDKELINDYITIHCVIIALYARNLFRYHSSWIKIKKLYNFDYKYIRDNETSYKLTDNETKLTEYANKLKIYYNIDYQSNKILYYEFVTFIKQSMNDMMNNIIIPVKIMSPKIKLLINKYKGYEYKTKTISKKLNYDALKLLQINID